MPVTSESRLIAAPVAHVWAALADLEAAARWNQAWQRVEYLSSQREGVGAAFRAHSEDGLSFDFEISAWEPLEYIAFTPLREREEVGYLISLESQAIHLQPVDDGATNVTFLARAIGHGLRGWLAARFFWPGYQQEGLRSALDRLQSLFEPVQDNEPAEDHEPPDES